MINVLDTIQIKKECSSADLIGKRARTAKNTVSSLDDSSNFSPSIFEMNKNWSKADESDTKGLLKIKATIEELLALTDKYIKDSSM